MRRNLLAFIALPICLAFSAPTATAQLPATRTPAQVNWNTVNDDLTRELTQNEIGKLAQKELNAPPPKTADDWLRRLALFVRADYPEQTHQLLRSRPRFLLTDKRWEIQYLVYQSANYDNIDLAKRLCELFPEQTESYNWFNRWAEQQKPGTVDKWLAQRGMAGSERWFHERLKFRAKLGTEQELLAPLAANIRKNPTRLEPVNTYLRAVSATGKPQDTDWIAEVIKPKLAVEAYTLARSLQGKAAISLFERALQMPFTPQDKDWYDKYVVARRNHYLGPNFALTEKLLDLWIKRDLLRRYQETNQTAQAQKLLEEITAEQNGGIPNTQLAYNAGQIQGISGARVIEKRIEAAEPEQKDTADYWLTRALYYSGRKEDKQAVEAFEKALSLAPRPADGALSDRWRVAHEYARHLWLRDIENPVDAFRFAYAEFDAAPPNSDTARGWVTELLHYDQKDSSRLLLPNDNNFWDFIAAQSDWQVHGRMLMERLLRNAPDQKDTIWKRADELANNAPSVERSRALGTLAYSEKDYARAAFWHEDAIKRLEKQETPNSQYELTTERTNLWRVYRHLNDWRGMERLLPQMKDDATPEFFAGTAVYDLAYATAESGEKAKAFQYFLQWVNQDRRPAPSQLLGLTSQGLVNEVRAFYKKMAQQEPQSVTPARVFKTIGAD